MTQVEYAKLNTSARSGIAVPEGVNATLVGTSLGSASNVPSSRSSKQF